VEQYEPIPLLHQDAKKKTPDGKYCEEMDKHQIILRILYLRENIL